MQSIKKIQLPLSIVWETSDIDWSSESITTHRCPLPINYDMMHDCGLA